ncbi:MAG: thioredoxin [Candidatus Aenigmarchaeota archaeon]|nr:thioredoxin [Candidatus Aenigmarchaeota archaeon]
MSNVASLNDKSFKEFVETNRIAIVDFYADWCAPCKMMEPHFESLAGEMKDRAGFGRINVDENRETAAKFGIMSIPTLIIFKDGRLVDRIIGALPKQMIKERLEKFLE